MPENVPESPTANLLLLCVDLQPAFLKAIPEHAAVLKRCTFAVRTAHGLGVRTVFTEQVPHKLGGTCPELLEGVASPAVFPKSTFSAFADEAIQAALTSPPTEHLLLCGIETSVCVYQTALDSLSAGLQVTVLSDCVGARRSDDAQVCLAALVRAGAHLLPAESVFYALLHDVQHPFFRSYTQLVKAYG